jgi:hypothetical protein
VKPSRTIESSGGGACVHDHAVEFYETDGFLVETVADFIVPALRGSGSAIVVATAEHRVAFTAALVAAGVDVDAASRAMRYQEFDAAHLLSTFMLDGAPDPARFRDVIGSVIDRASAGGREVRVYGEMVALLWADGDVTSTIAVEDLWNDLAVGRQFALLCAYPVQGFDDRSRAVFEDIRGRHSSVGSADGDPYASGADHAADIGATGAAVGFEHCRAEVQGLVERRTEIGVVERVIDAYPLDRDERAALWLWACGCRVWRRSRPIGPRGAADRPRPHTDPE